MLSIGATAAAVVALAFGIYAFNKREEANNNAKLANEKKREAEFRSGQAQDLISFMLKDLRKQLKPIGKLDILDAVGVKAMGYFDELGDDLSGDDALFRVEALRQIGEVRFDQGKLDPALAVFEKSRNYAQPLQEDEPSNNDYLFEFGQAEFWVGYAAMKQGNLDQAERSFTRYMELSRDLLAREPDNRIYQGELMYAHRNLGAVALKSGDTEAALKHFDETLSLNQQLVEANPKDLTLQFELVESHSWIGSAMLQTHRLADAETSYQQAFDLLQTMIERDDRPRYKEELADLARFLAEAHLHQGDSASAEEMLHRSLSINEDLVEYDPTNAKWLYDHLRTRHSFAHLHYAMGAGGEPEAGIEVLVREFSKMHKADESDVRVVGHLSLCERLLALVQLESEVPEAVVTIETAWNRIESLQSNPDALQYVALIAETRGRIYEVTDDRERSRKTREAALSMLKDETSLGLVELAIRRQLHAQLGDTAEALRIKAILDKAGFADPRYFPSRKVTPR